MKQKKVVGILGSVFLAIILVLGTWIWKQAEAGFEQEESRNQESSEVFTELPEDFLIKESENVEDLTKTEMINTEKSKEISKNETVVGICMFNESEEYINAKGEPILDYSFKQMRIPSEGMFAAQDFAEKWKIYDLQGKVLADIEGYPQDVMEFNEGFAVFGNGDGKYGYIDRNGKIVIPLQYSDARGFIDGVAVVMKDNRFYKIDTKGNIVYSFPPGYFHSCIDGSGVFCPDDPSLPSEFIDKDGEVISTGPYGWGCYIDKAHYLITAANRGSSKVIDKNGNLIRSYHHDPEGDHYFNEGILMEYTNNGKLRYTDLLTGQMIGQLYDDGDIFHNGYAVVQLDGKYHIIDRNGKMVLDCSQYTYVLNGHCGFFQAETDSESFLIDHRGNVLRRFPWGELTYCLFSDGNKTYRNPW